MVYGKESWIVGCMCVFMLWVLHQILKYAAISLSGPP